MREKRGGVQVTLGPHILYLLPGFSPIAFLAQWLAYVTGVNNPHAFPESNILTANMDMGLE